MTDQFSLTFARKERLGHGFAWLWRDFCHELLNKALGASALVRTDRDTYGMDLFLPDSRVALLLVGVDEPSAQSPLPAAVRTAVDRAMACRSRHPWEQFVVGTNAQATPRSFQAITAAIKGTNLPEQALGLVGSTFWAELADNHEAVVSRWFDYRVVVPEAEVRAAFVAARYYDRYVREYEQKIAAASFFVVLTSNRSPVELEVPFSPELTVKHLLDVAQELFGVELSASEYADMGTSASLRSSLRKDGVAQTFDKTLAEVPVRKGDSLQMFLQIRWRDAPTLRGADSPFVGFTEVEPLVARFNFTLGADSPLARVLDQAGKLPRDKGPATIARKARQVGSTMLRTAASLLEATGARTQPQEDTPRAPVRFGASAPSRVKPRSRFRARFVAYHGDLEAAVAEQLEALSPGASHELDRGRASWTLGTEVEIHVHGEDLKVHPPKDRFVWGGEKHLLDFSVRVDAPVGESRDLEFEVWVEGFRICRVWMELRIASETSTEHAEVHGQSPQTAFASYASADRLRVLDRVATLETHCGLQVFLDCVSMRPNAKWQALLPEMVLRSDQLLLFWSEAAQRSQWVDREWRIAFEAKGIDGIEVHPLVPYDQAPLPAELAEFVHGNDPMMVIRAHEQLARSSREGQ